MIERLRRGILHEFRAYRTMTTADISQFRGFGKEPRGMGRFLVDLLFGETFGALGYLYERFLHLSTPDEIIRMSQHRIDDINLLKQTYNEAKSTKG